MIVENDVLTVLSCANTEGSALYLIGQLDRSLYTKTNKVLEAAGGRWNRKAKAHVFDGEAAERIEQIILTGSIDVPKDDFEYFPTPPVVVERMMEWADIQDGHLVLEPSAGRGALAIAAKACGVNVAVDMYELMPANHAALIALNLPLSGVADACDFLTVEPKPIYDRVVMNPPFGKQADIKHVMHALQFLKPSGLLVSVMSAGITFRNNTLTTNFRNLIRERGGDIEGLPCGSFKASGTGVNTVLVMIPGVEGS